MPIEILWKCTESTKTWNFCRTFYYKCRKKSSSFGFLSMNGFFRTRIFVPNPNANPNLCSESESAFRIISKGKLGGGKPAVNEPGGQNQGGKCVFSYTATSPPTQKRRVKAWKTTSSQRFGFGRRFGFGSRNRIRIQQIQQKPNPNTIHCFGNHFSATSHFCWEWTVIFWKKKVSQPKFQKGPNWNRSELKFHLESSRCHNTHNTEAGTGLLCFFLVGEGRVQGGGSLRPGIRPELPQYQS